MKALFDSPLKGKAKDVDMYRGFLASLAIHDQKSTLNVVLHLCSNHLLSIPDQLKAIGGVGALIFQLIEGQPHLRTVLIEWLSSLSGGSLAAGVAMNRSVVCALSESPGMFLVVNLGSKLIFADEAKKALERLLEHFADKMYIKHRPIHHQEGQTLLKTFE